MIYESLEEIKIKSYLTFNHLVKGRIKENAYKYLQNRRGSKGHGIAYSELKLSKYLLPYNKELDIE